jgi:hypothetical protein
VTAKRRRRGLIEALRALEISFAERRAGADETGAALILALIFLIVAALTLTALVTFAGTGLLVTSGITSQRGLQYGADGAVEIAIQHVRYQADAYPTLLDCLGTTTGTPTNSSVQLTEYQVTATYMVHCSAIPFQYVFNSSTATTTNGKTFKTATLFTSSNPSFVGYGFSIFGSGTVTRVVAETTFSNTITLLKSAMTSGPNQHIQLIAPYQRLVAFYACRATSLCQTSRVPTYEQNVEKPYSGGNPAGYLVKAVVGLGDLAPAGTFQCNLSTTSTCGESVQVLQWTVASANH